MVGFRCTALVHVTAGYHRCFEVIGKLFGNMYDQTVLIFVSITSTVSALFVSTRGHLFDCPSRHRMGFVQYNLKYGAALLFDRTVA